MSAEGSIDGSGSGFGSGSGWTCSGIGGGSSRGVIERSSVGTTGLVIALFDRPLGNDTAGAGAAALGNDPDRFCCLHRYTEKDCRLPADIESHNQSAVTSGTFHSIA